MNTRPKNPRRRRVKLGCVAAGLLLLGAGPAPVAAEPTAVTVRVLSRDAKFIGTSMGGAHIVIRDVLSDEVLASGVTVGSTGNTKTIMHRASGRRARLTADDAAAFNATLELDEPRLIEVTAYGPLAQAQAANRVAAQQWVVPGRHLTGGDGWMLVMPGFAVDVLTPPAHSRLKDANTEIEIRANVVMMCGCPIEPGGLWDANAYEVRAIVRRDGEAAGTYELRYAGQTSQFAFNLPLTSAGQYDVTVYAYDAANGNTGLDRTTFFAY